MRNSLFQVLDGGLVGGKSLKSFSVKQQTSYTSSNSSCTILLWIEILWFTKRPIFDSCQVRLWIVKCEKLFLAETPHQFILTITTVHDITKIVCVEFVRPALNHGIIRNADACMYKCSSVPKQKRTIIQNW